MATGARSKASLVALATALIAGCATGPQFTDAQRASILTPISCATRSECDGVWARLQAWVATNSRWRIQIANDVVIQTFGPSTIAGSSTDVAYSLVRNPTPAGGATITIKASCANMFGCFPDPVDAIRQMKASAGI